MSENVRVCQFFLRGRCKREKCQFRHPLEVAGSQNHAEISNNLLIHIRDNMQCVSVNNLDFKQTCSRNLKILLIGIKPFDSKSNAVCF